MDKNSVLWKQISSFVRNLDEIKSVNFIKIYDFSLVILIQRIRSDRKDQVHIHSPSDLYLTLYSPTPYKNKRYRFCDATYVAGVRFCLTV
jgi:hypothetical protein